jgi:CTP:molybdopterin cytidylyltransferase MocA
MGPGIEGAAYDVIVLAGGTSRRLGGSDGGGGIDKLSLPVAGRPLLDHVLLACRGARRVVAVGPPRPVLAHDEAGRASYELVWCREDPPGEGPLAAAKAGAARSISPIVVIVGGDMPFVGPLTTRLVAAVAGGAAAAACPDPAGRPLPLPVAFARDTLFRRMFETTNPFAPAGPLRLLLERVEVTLVPAEGEDADVDTPEQLAAARDRAEHRP